MQLGKGSVLFAIVAACGMFVLYAEGLYWFSLWNLTPLAFVAYVLRYKRPSAAGLVFAGFTTLAIVLTHAAWVFDWGGTQTGSSTAGLIFLFSPIYSLILGIGGWGITKIVERILGANHT